VAVTRRFRFDPFWIAAVIVVAVAIGGIWAQVYLTRDCERRGGVLIKGYNGLAQCVALERR
jgi:hypothetical protein